VLQGERAGYTDKQESRHLPPRWHSAFPRRGVPQIESHFEASTPTASCSVTAKDKGPRQGAEASRSPAPSTLGENEVEEMVKDAEANASAEQGRSRERIDPQEPGRNPGSQPRSSSRARRKVSAEDKGKVEATHPASRRRFAQEDYRHEQNLVGTTPAGLLCARCLGVTKPGGCAPPNGAAATGRRQRQLGLPPKCGAAGMWNRTPSHREQR